MSLLDRVKPLGWVLIRKYDQDGNLVYDELIPNVVCTIGKQRGASHWASANPGKTLITHVAFGTSTDAASSEDLGLGAEFYREALDSVFAVAATLFGQTTVLGNDIGAGQTWTIYEMGLLDAAAGGNLICTVLLATAVELTGTERLDLLWGVVVT